MAAVCGNYDCLRGGLACEAMMDMTGCPSTNTKIADVSQEELSVPIAKKKKEKKKKEEEKKGESAVVIITKKKKNKKRGGDNLSSSLA